MIPTLVSGLILMKKRRMMEVIPPHLRKLWKEWELIGAALLSLTLQLVLIMLGNRRKYWTATWFRFVVWFAYMLADSVATLALGILSNDLGQIYDDGGHIDVASEFKAFWAPFFLLHLGGPDTITAYSLEDNELYPRHLFGQIVQTTATLYILLLAWTSSTLSYLSIVVMVVGSIKYGERTLALWRASRDNLRDSILTGPDPDLRYTKIMEKYASREAEGYFVDIVEMEEVLPKTEEVLPKMEELGPNSDKNPPKKAAENENNIIRAHALFQTFKSLFADLILSYHDRDRSQALFKEISVENAFNVIEIELGFMYDLVYTKALAIYAPWGFVRRLITFFLTCLVFMFFILDDKLRHNRTHFVVTLLLLVVAIFLEIYAALIVLASDQTRVWLIKHGMTSIRSLVEWFKWFKVKRWSNSIAQYSLLWISLKEKLSLKIIEEFRYRESNDFSEEYRKLIFNHVKMKFEQFEEQRKEPVLRSTSSETALREFCNQRGKSILDETEKMGQVNLKWSISVEFDQSILIWHMATEICYYYQEDGYSPENLSDDVNLSRDFSLHMSRYMFYLLVIRPSLLSDRIDIMRIRHTRAEAMKFFEKSSSSSVVDVIRRRIEAVNVNKTRTDACKLLFQLKLDIPPIKITGNRNKSVLFDACRLASDLNRILDTKFRWDLIRDMWLEQLTYAAFHVRLTEHAQQLRRGGELLTHVWLLMAHFGLTEQCQMSRVSGKARLVIK